MEDGRIDFACSAPVAEARAAGRPIVALESTLISHGLPYPENIEVARAAEAAVRAELLEQLRARMPIGVGMQATMPLTNGSGPETTPGSPHVEQMEF